MAASSEIGRQSAGVSLPMLPARCRDTMPRVNYYNPRWFAGLVPA